MSETPVPENILLIDKPKGITSFDVIRILRKKMGIRKMGHAGTLDPLATGLLIIGVNNGTKKLKNLFGLDKTYEAQILLGVETSTGDLEGDILREESVNTVDLEHLDLILGDLTGTLTLPVPKYSAVKVKGTPLYRYARQGKDDIKPPRKEMRIHEMQLTDHYPANGNYILELTMRVSSGTYVRSIAIEIGDRLGLPATVAGIRRTEIGDFSVSQAETLETDME